MPTIPKFTLCLDLGCKQQRSKFNAYCMEHGGRDTFNHTKYNATDKRIEASQKYSTKQWRTLRQVQLSKHPLCAACLQENKITPALHLDHLFPWSSIGDTKILASASTLEAEVRKTIGNGGNAAAAAAVGKRIAEKAKLAGVTAVAFDRSGHKYHGRIKALADAARENGLQF